jgi:hypothetical protein
MEPLIPDGSRLTVRFGRREIAPGDVVLYAAGNRIIAHRVLRLGRRGRRWGFVRVKGDPVRTGEASWVAVEEVLGRVLAVRRPDGSVVLLNTAGGRLANRAAALISGVSGWTESRARRALGASKPLTVTPALLGLLHPLYRLGDGRRGREAGLLLRPEERFLTLAARPRLEAEDRARLQVLLSREILWERVAGAASSLGLAPLLYRNLTRPELKSSVPPSILASLSRSAHAAGCLMAIQLEALDAILASLRGSGIEPVLLKGSALALSLYDQPSLRTMQDIDLLLRPVEIAEALRLLEELGYRRLSGGRGEAFYAGHHHAVPMVGKGGRVIVEVHRGLVPQGDGLRIDPAPFLERAPRVVARGSTYRVLSREDQILHACLHLSYCDRFVGKLRDLMDVHSLVEMKGRDPAWGAILGAASPVAVARSLYSTLDLARRLLGTRVPPEVLNELKAASGWDPLAERLLRTVARSSLFSSAGGDSILPGASARWMCDAMIKRTRWTARVRDLVHLFGEA